ncbi:BolA family protein [Nitrococcus mobilis]|uniref:Putative stress-induced morphogen BolA n=1 Tax=Nitrococcus mobilis Nb-231 TaxID=314278 RepID=A4BM31_9GAMM|nr:BolA family protein [Nitrococcus mobilis]EAR23369.1 putative stress-induced morphogen BolA [Nitrococcus mobilis Nb-231]
MTESRVVMIEQRLRAALQVETVTVRDDSRLHAGHAGAKDGGGHYRVLIVSPDFTGRSTLQRHRMVYEAMGEAMRADTIHALSIQALSPQEHQQQDKG